MQLFILILGLAVVIWIWFSNKTHKVFFNTVKLLLRGIKTYGTVKSVTSTKDGDGAILYLLDVEFKDSNNETISFQPVQGSYKPDIGTQVLVKYDPTKPSNAMLHQFQTYVGVVLQVGLLLFVFIMWSQMLLELVNAK